MAQFSQKRHARNCLQNECLYKGIFKQLKGLQHLVSSVILLFVLLVSRVFAVTRRAELVNEKYHSATFLDLLLNDTPGNVDYTLYRKLKGDS